ncbi:kinesin-like protein KIF25 [Haliotis cracherodii]|uniref:kinesin-like protein KIF25 n=1 Tax=Haliotis cracherodii TaxID=6455 RepID=UPI0039E7C2FE
MPLGLDRSHFLTGKVKEQDIQLRKKQERIASLETENAMLYLKLAQLRGEVQSSREGLTDVAAKYDAERRFRSQVSEKASKFKQEIDLLREGMGQVMNVASRMPEQFQSHIDHASAVVRQHRQVYQDHSSSLSVLQDQVLVLQAALQDVTDRHGKEKKRRQALHNTLMELRGNIRVHCRVRPLMEFDCGNEDVSTLGRSGAKSEVVVHFYDDENVCIRTAKHNKVFEFERVYSPDEKQAHVFDEVQPMLTSLLDGYNVSIMAYGQTGSGKTHTMLGSHRNDDYHPSNDMHPDEGVIPRATRELFRLISEKPPGTHSLEVSVVEIYNNDIRDLLSRDTNVKHDVVTGSDGLLSLPTITSKQVSTVYDVMCLVQRGLRTRRESATMVHEHSSRSHLVVTLTLISQAPSFFAVGGGPKSDAEESVHHKKSRSQSLTHSSLTASGWSSPDQSGASSLPSNQQPVIRTKLQLVDLAGSECVGMSGVKGAALREASHINKSLSALADVLGALSENRTHVPYRNSKLTHLLQDSIGGDAKLLVLLCVSPSQRYITESLQCLGFGQRARQVQRGPTKRRLPTSAEKVHYEARSNSPKARSSSASEKMITSQRF